MITLLWQIAVWEVRHEISVFLRSSHIYIDFRYIVRVFPYWRDTVTSRVTCWPLRNGWQMAMINYCDDRGVREQCASDVRLQTRSADIGKINFYSDRPTVLNRDRPVDRDRLVGGPALWRWCPRPLTRLTHGTPIGGVPRKPTFRRGWANVSERQSSRARGRISVRHAQRCRWIPIENNKKLRRLDVHACAYNTVARSLLYRECERLRRVCARVCL